MTITYNTTELPVWVYKNKVFPNYYFIKQISYLPEKAHKKGRAVESPACVSSVSIYVLW
jgi:hypothetical protein